MYFVLIKFSFSNSVYFLFYTPFLATLMPPNIFVSIFSGLWRYTDWESHSSVYKSTVINTSKEMNAYSDLPVPEDWASFLHNKKMYEYICIYTDHFNLRPHIRLSTPILSIEPADTDAKQSSHTRGSGAAKLRFPKWNVTYKTLSDPESEDAKFCRFHAADGKVVTEQFDAVMMCTGHHSVPRMPDFRGMKNFQGKQMHSHAYKDHQGFEGKNVVVVGIGNSGVDVAVELSRFANQVYLSTRSGAWILPRLSFGGVPFDHLNCRAFAMLPIAARTVIGKVVSSLLVGDVARHNIHPTHDIFAAHPTVNGELVGRFVTGSVIGKRNIDHLTTDGVVFEDTPDEEIKADAIVYCTGYKVTYPYLDMSPNSKMAFMSKYIDTATNDVSLYDFVFVPEDGLQNFGFIGLFQPLGSILPMSEMQARWFVLQLKQAFGMDVPSSVEPLPSATAMKAKIRMEKDKIGKRYKKSARHTIQADYLPFMDNIARKIGVMPPTTKLFFTDPKLWHAIVFGPATAHQFRLQGPNSWKPARETILQVNANAHKTYRKQSSSSGMIFKLIIVLVALFVLYYYLL
jgi:dimethylaniline monooxygenase (N-oxide forming) / hypotaurine monooxygenase